MRFQLLDRRTGSVSVASSDTDTIDWRISHILRSILVSYRGAANVEPSGILLEHGRAIVEPVGH